MKRGGFKNHTEMATVVVGFNASLGIVRVGVKRVKMGAHVLDGLKVLQSRTNYQLGRLKGGGGGGEIFIAEITCVAAAVLVRMAFLFDIGSPVAMIEILMGLRFYSLSQKHYS